MTQRRRARLTTWVEDIHTGLAVPDVLELDPDRLTELRVRLREVAAATQRVLEDSRGLLGVEPPADDEVSLRSTAEIRSLIAEDDSSFIRICEEIHAWVLHFESEVDQALAQHGMAGVSR